MVDPGAVGDLAAVLCGVKVLVEVVDHAVTVHIAVCRQRVCVGIECVAEQIHRIVAVDNAVAVYITGKRIRQRRDLCGGKSLAAAGAYK